MHIFRGSLQNPWLVANREIPKGFNLQSMMETASKLASNVELSVVNHTNPPTFSLVGYQPKSNDCHLRPCDLLEWGDYHSLLNSSTAIPKIVY